MEENQAKAKTKTLFSMRNVFIKIVAISIIPVILMGVISCVVFILRYNEIIEEEIREELRTTAYGLSDNFNYLDHGDYYKASNGDIYKGETVVSGKLTQMQVEIIRNGLVCTFFYEDSRIDTSVIDISGKNMSGTKMDEEIYKSIYESGREVFAEKIVLGGREYYGYYIPVFNSDGTAKACFFAGKLRQDVMDRVGGIASMMIWIGIFIVLSGIVISVFLAIYLVNNVYKRLGEERDDSIKKEVGKLQEEYLNLVKREIDGSLDEITILNDKLLSEDLSGTAKDKALGIKECTNDIKVAFNTVNNYSHLESGNTNVEVRAYNIINLIEDCKSGVTAGIERKNLTLSTEFAEDLPEFLRGDSVKMKQIIDNLLINAVKYTYEGGVDIHVASRTIRPGVVDLLITIKDTGIGIRKEDIDKLFSSFGKTGMNKEAGIKGTGLGLLICKRLVNLMDGRISVESDLGTGTTFKVAIPQEVVQE